MTEIGFYHLTRSTLEDALPRLLEKACAAGNRVVVRVGDPERVEMLSRALWTYGRDSFLPHGAKGDGWPERQPVWLTAGTDNPNGAAILVLAEGAEAEDLARFGRCLELFDGGDPTAVARARERWRRAVAEGHEVVYWQQNERGGWTRAGGRAGSDAGA